MDFFLGLHVMLLCLHFLAFLLVKNTLDSRTQGVLDYQLLVKLEGPYKIPHKNDGTHPMTYARVAF